MDNSNPKSINDDYVRTWTISSSPPFDSNTNTFQATNKVSCTIKHQRHGVISSLLHSHSGDQQSPLRAKFFGVGGDFTCFDESNPTPQKLLFIAGGIDLPRSINLCRTRPFSHNLRPYGMHRITVVLHRAINDRIRSDTEISDHITAVSNRIRQGK
ncbi:unnamed protein product [Rotaria magnacalcarata]|uniref:Uncharacterized protein n=1 Tax=Rotaria magnacalcarata TaxID=392030 RepID=A0A817AEI7_9BILA|nr:unnamed protein product [Rotaria magnacalcarata]CAF5174582.1 unnamed protein product [Rotaria magnacalcarata]